MNLDDLNDNLGTELESEDYDSLGGFIIEHLDRLTGSWMIISRLKIRFAL